MYTVQNLLNDHNIRLAQPSNEAAEIADRLLSNKYSEYDALQEYGLRINDAAYLAGRGESWAALYQYPGYLAGSQFPEAFEALENAAEYYKANGFPPQNSREYGVFNTFADILVVGGAAAFHHSGELVALPEARRVTGQPLINWFGTLDMQGIGNDEIVPGYTVRPSF